MAADSVRVTTLDLLRHGECEGGEIFRGSTDVALTERGWQQMRMTLAQVEPAQVMVSSPLLRCATFANQLAVERGMQCVIENDLREIHYGDWEGVLRDQVVRNDGERMRLFFQDPIANSPPGGESVVAFTERVIAVLNRLLTDRVGQHLLLVTHGAVMRALTCHLLDMPMRSMGLLAVPYAGFSRFRLYHQSGSKPWVQLCLHLGEAASGLSGAFNQNSESNGD